MKPLFFFFILVSLLLFVGADCFAGEDSTSFNVINSTDSVDSGEPDDLYWSLYYSKSDSLEVKGLTLGMVFNWGTRWNFRAQFLYLKLARFEGYSDKFRLTGDYVAAAGVCAITGASYLFLKLVGDSSNVARTIVAGYVLPLFATLVNPTLSYSVAQPLRVNVGYDAEYHFFSYEDGLTFRPRIGLEVGSADRANIHVGANYEMFWSFEKSSRNFGPGLFVQINLSTYVMLAD